MLTSLISQIFLVVIAIVSALGGFLSWWSNRPKVTADTGKVSAETEELEYNTWIKRLDALSKDLTRLQKLSDERFERLIEIETLITEHVQWDFHIVRECRQRGWHIEDPPSLVYVKRKIEEEKEVIKKQMGESK